MLLVIKQDIKNLIRNKEMFRETTNFFDISYQTLNRWINKDDERLMSINFLIYLRKTLSKKRQTKVTFSDLLTNKKNEINI